MSRRDAPRSFDLWLAPTADRAPPRLLADARRLGGDDAVSETERARRERARVFEAGLTEFQWTPDSRRLLVPFGGDVFRLELESGHATCLGLSGATDARLAPTGDRLAFVRDGRVWWASLDGGEPVPVSPAGERAVSYGVAEFVAAEELARDTGWWWRPDGEAVAYTRVDEAAVELVRRLHINPDQVGEVEQRFPRAGAANARVDLFVQTLLDVPPVQVDLGPDPDVYLARVDWSSDGGVLYVQRLSRDQQTLDLLAVEPATGASRVVLRERQAPWINLSLDFLPLHGGRFLWSSERTGYRHLYLHEADGTLVRAVTQGAFPLAGQDRIPSIAGLDEAIGQVFVQASRETPLERHLFAAEYGRVRDLRRLTDGEGWWTIDCAGPHGFVGTFSAHDTPPRTGLYDGDGRLRRWLSPNPLDEQHPYAPYRTGLPEPEFGWLTSEDGHELHYVLLKPADFDPGRRWPVVVQVYGGPNRQKVTRAWRAPEERLLLEAGFLLFQLDNRGSSNRGLAFESAIAGRLGEPEVRDQLVGLRHLQSLPFVDPARIGVTGWSYGGFLTLRLLTEPGAGFAAGAAGAAPAEWRLYDTAYTERYLGRPQDRPEAYHAASIRPRLKNLNGRLLLMHGMADDNVLLENAVALMAEMQAQKLLFEMMLYPGERHSIVDAPRQAHFQKTLVDFFTRALAAPGGATHE
jgi:dipeptidyl-peptidase 4